MLKRLMLKMNPDRLEVEPNFAFVLFLRVLSTSPVVSYDTYRLNEPLCITFAFGPAS